MTYRVVQWGTGNVGIHSLRYLINHPDYELVGLHAHSERKIGQDAAVLAGLPAPCGVMATNDVAALLALQPDCVVYNANGENRPQAAVADLVRILEAGINVVSTALIFAVYPPFAEASLREPLAAACARGNSTLYISGVDPGFSGDVLPLAALQLTDGIEEVLVQELVDYSTYQDPEFTGMAFGFGQPETATPIMAIPGVLTGAWGGMVRMIADRLGVQLEGIRESYERDFTPVAYDTPMMPVPANTCDAVRFRLEGMVNGKPLIITEHVNRLRCDAATYWPMPPAGKQGVHRCVVKGNPSVQLDAFLEGKDGDYNTGGVQATALRMINAIPAVCAHAAGHISTLDLPYTPSTHVCR
jgi:hypothetical protein